MGYPKGNIPDANICRPLHQGGAEMPSGRGRL